MAKRASAAAAADADLTGTGNVQAAPVGLNSFSAKIRKVVMQTKAGVLKAAHQFASFKETAAALSEKIATAFGEAAAEMQKIRPTAALTTAEFARLYDESVPRHPRRSNRNPEDGYQQHKTYMAINYMLQQERRKATRPTGRSGVKDIATNVTLRLFATILRAFMGSEHEKLWRGLETECKLSPKQIAGIRKAINDNVLPALPLAEPEGKPLQVAKIVHMESTRKTAAEREAEAAAALEGAAAAVGVRRGAAGAVGAAQRRRSA